MTIDALATIIAAVLSALITALVTRLDDVSNFFLGSTRKINGDWEGYSYLNPGGTDNSWIETGIETGIQPDIQYNLHLTQVGRKINGWFTIVNAPDSVSVRRQKVKGIVIRDYFSHDVQSITPNEFRFSTVLLNIHTDGKEMDGFFVANSGSRGHSVCVGFTIVKKKG